MCLWKSPRMKLLQWWIIEDSAGDLRHLGGTGASLACSVHGSIWCVSAPPMWCSVHPSSPTCRLHQLLQLISYFLFLSSMLHQMMVHWESFYAWKTKICLFLPDRIHSAWLCLTILFSTQLINFFFLKTKAWRSIQATLQKETPVYLSSISILQADVMSYICCSGCGASKPLIWCLSVK